MVITVQIIYFNYIKKQVSRFDCSTQEKQLLHLTRTTLTNHTTFPSIGWFIVIDFEINYEVKFYNSKIISNI